MEKIKRFIECLMPYYNCNIKCDYCYVVQGNYRGKKGLQFDYPLDVMKRALTKERFGGSPADGVPCDAASVLLPALSGTQADRTFGCVF